MSVTIILTNSNGLCLHIYIRFSGDFVALCRAFCFSLWLYHTLMLLKMGTCAMKPKENGGVVDARLNVYGIQNLKITGTI